MRRILPALAVTCLVHIGTPAFLFADTILFSTLPATAGVVPIGDDEYLDAFGFVPGVRGTVDRLTLPIGSPVDTGTFLHFSIWTSAGSMPAAPLGSFAYTPATQPAGSTATLTAAGPIMLDAGLLYFLVAGTNDLIDLYEGSAGITGPVFRRHFDDPWQARQVGATPAFALTHEDQAPVPEPGTLILLGMGLTGLAARRRKPTAPPVTSRLI